MRRTRGGKKIGRGEYGNVYRPVLKNANHSENRYSEGYVGKVMKEEDAKIEYANSMKVQALDPEGLWSITAIKMSRLANSQNNANFERSEQNRKTKKNKFIKNTGLTNPDPLLLFYPSTTQIIYKYGGQSLASLLTKSGAHVYGGNYDVSDINTEKLPEFVQACKSIIPGLNVLNKKYIHQDLHLGNILWDGKTARMIDFGEMVSVEERFAAKKSNFIGNLEALGLRKRTGNAALQLYDVIMDRIDMIIMEDAVKYDAYVIYENLHGVLRMDWVKERFPGKYDDWLKLTPFSRCDYIQAILTVPE